MHNGELHYLYSSPYNISMTKSGSMNCMRHVTHIGLIRNLERKRHL